MGKGPTLPEFLVIGHILAPQGTKGEVKVQVITDFPDRFSPGNAIYINGQPLTIVSSRARKQHLLIKLADIDSIQDAECLRHKDLTIPISEIRSLPPDEYYAFQLIGLDVLTSEGKSLGQVVDIISGASNDIYIVNGEQGEILIPAIEDVVKSIDLSQGQMTIEVIDGLL